MIHLYRHYALVSVFSKHEDLLLTIVCKQITFKLCNCSITTQCIPVWSISGAIITQYRNMHTSIYDAQTLLCLSVYVCVCVCVSVAKNYIGDCYILLCTILICRWSSSNHFLPLQEDIILAAMIVGEVSTGRKLFSVYLKLTYLLRVFDCFLVIRR